MRRRLLVAFVTLALVVVLAFGIPLALAVRSYVRAAELSRLERVAAAVAVQVTETEGPIDPSIALPAVIDARVALYDTAALLVVGEGPATADQAVRRALRDGRTADSMDGEVLVVAAPVGESGRLSAVVRVAEAVDATTDRTSTAWAVMAALGCMAVAAAAAVGWLQTRRILQPLDAVGMAAERLGAGDFASRPLTSGLVEIDRVAAAVARTAERLGGMLQRERAFSTEASHQLRTHITGLSLLLAEAAADPPSARGPIEAAEAVVERLAATVEDLLSLARELPGRPDMTDLAPILEGLEPLWGGRLRAAGRRLEVTAPPSLPARATPARAAQALDVLVGNAEAHGAGTVRVTASTADGAVIVEVADEGEVTIGPEVFATRQPGSGHGIGLALARSLAEADGGELTLHHAGPGCSFRLILGSD